MLSLKLIKYIFRNNKTKKKIFFLFKTTKKREQFKKLNSLFKVNKYIKKNFLKNISLKKKLYLLKYFFYLKKKVLKYKKKNIYLSKKINKFFVKKNYENNEFFLYKKLLGIMTKKGLKTKSIKILQNALHFASIKTHITTKNLLNILYKKLKIFVETKTIKKRKKNYIVPFPITKKRSFFLIAKWILSVIKKKKIKNVDKFLAKEIINLVLKKKSNALKLKKINISNSLKNKSNLHFRW